MVRNRHNVGMSHPACFRCLLSELYFSLPCLLLAGPPLIILTIASPGWLVQMNPDVREWQSQKRRKMCLQTRVLDKMSEWGDGLEIPPGSCTILTSVFHFTAFSSEIGKHLFVKEITGLSSRNLAASGEGAADKIWLLMCAHKRHISVETWKVSWTWDFVSADFLYDSTRTVSQS